MNTYTSSSLYSPKHRNTIGSLPSFAQRKPRFTIAGVSERRKQKLNHCSLRHYHQIRQNLRPYFFLEKSLKPILSCTAHLYICYRYIVCEPRSTSEIGNDNFLICLGARFLCYISAFEHLPRLTI